MHRKDMCKPLVRCALFLTEVGLLVQGNALHPVQKEKKEWWFCWSLSHTHYKRAYQLPITLHLTTLRFKSYKISAGVLVVLCICPLWRIARMATTCLEYLLLTLTDGIMHIQIAGLYDSCKCCLYQALSRISEAVSWTHPKQK